MHCLPRHSSDTRSARIQPAFAATESLLDQRATDDTGRLVTCARRAASWPLHPTGLPAPVVPPALGVARGSGATGSIDAPRRACWVILSHTSTVTQGQKGNAESSTGASAESSAKHTLAPMQTGAVRGAGAVSRVHTGWLADVLSDASQSAAAPANHSVGAHNAVHRRSCCAA